MSERHPDAGKSQLLTFITNRTAGEHLVRVVTSEAERLHSESLRCQGLGLLVSAWDLSTMADAFFGIRNDLAREINNVGETDADT